MGKFDMKELDAVTKKKYAAVTNVFRFLLLAAVITAGIFYLNDKEDFSLRNILALAPHNIYLAAAFTLLLFAVKSLFFAFPIIIPYLISSILLPPLWAFIINIAGSAVSATIPFWMGRFSGGDAIDRILRKYPRLREMVPKTRGKKWFMAYLIRIVSIFPVDIVGMFMGSTGISFKTYITASIVGMLPGALFATLIGKNITNPRSPGFIISVAATVFLAVISVVFYKIKITNDKRKKIAENGL
ncbi:MAG: VTT domain-containing protein [Eubacteriales bacterium]|nr:VTT domain-containing protein [Eubacteriales bacterium]